MPLNKDLLIALTKKPFKTLEAQAALGALVLAGNDSENFTQALKDHQSFWESTGLKLKELLEPHGDGDANEKAANNIDALWRKAIDIYGLDNLTQDEFGSINKKNTTKSFQKTLQDKQTAFNTNLAAFKQLAPLLPLNFSSLTLPQQNIVLTKAREPNSKFIENLNKVTTRAELEKTLGFKLNDKDEEWSNEFLKTNLNKKISDMRAHHKENLKQFGFEDEHLATLTTILNNLSPKDQNHILNKIEQDPSLLNQALQAKDEGELSKILGRGILINGEIKELLLFNKGYSNKKNERITKEVNPEYNVKAPDPVLKNRGDTGYSEDKEKYEQALETYHQELTTHNALLNFNNYLNRFTSSKLDEDVLKNLQDAFILSADLASFKKCISNEDMFKEVMNKKIGGWWSGHYLPSKEIGYKFTPTQKKQVVTIFQNMTETEFNQLKSDAREKRFEIATNHATYNITQSHAQAQASAYLELEQEIFFEPIQGQFKAITDTIQDYKDGLFRLTQKDPSGKNPRSHLSGRILEAVTSQEIADFEEALQSSLAEGQATVDTLDDMLDKLKLYNRSIQSIKNKISGYPYINDVHESVNTTIEQITKARTDLEKEIQLYTRPEKPQASIFSWVKSIVGGLAGTKPKLSHSDWDTTIRAVDPAHLANKSVDKSGAKELSTLNAQTTIEQEPATQPGQVLEYVVSDKDNQTPDKVGVFRKAVATDLQHQDREKISLEVTVIPKDSTMRVKTALDAASQFLKTHKKGDPIVLGGRDEEAVADLYHALLGLGVRKSEMTFRLDSAFDPDKHQNTFHFVFGFKGKSKPGISEEHFKENQHLVESAAISLRKYREHCGSAHKDIKKLTQDAKEMAQAIRKVRTDPNEASDTNDKAPNNPQP